MTTHDTVFYPWPSAARVRKPPVPEKKSPFASSSSPSLISPLGVALVCPDARYASVAWRGAERLDRRHATPVLWKQIDQEQELGLPPGPLKSTSTFAVLFLEPDRRRSVIVQYVSAMPIEVSRPDATVTELDSLLRSLSPAESATS